MPKIIIFILIMVFGVMIGVGLIHQIVDALQAGTRLDKSVEEVNQLQSQNNQLKKQYAQVKSYDFVEEVARNKLNLVKPNETVIFIPKSDLEKVLEGEKPKQEVKLSNLQGWLRLFF